MHIKCKCVKDDLDEVKNALIGQSISAKVLKNFSTVITMISACGNGNEGEICGMENAGFKLSDIYNAPCEDKDQTLKDVMKIYIIATTGGEKIKIEPQCPKTAILHLNYAKSNCKDI
jgi:hypothetical protein